MQLRNMEFFILFPYIVPWVQSCKKGWDEDEGFFHTRLCRCQNASGWWMKNRISLRKLGLNLEKYFFINQWKNPAPFFSHPSKLLIDGTFDILCHRSGVLFTVKNLWPCTTVLQKSLGFKLKGFESSTLFEALSPLTNYPHSVSRNILTF